METPAFINPLGTSIVVPAPMTGRSRSGVGGRTEASPVVPVDVAPRWTAERDEAAEGGSPCQFPKYP